MYLAVSDAIDSAQSNPAIRCLRIASLSGVFTAGNDIGDFLQAATASEDAARPRNAVIAGEQQKADQTEANRLSDTAALLWRFNQLKRKENALVLSLRSFVDPEIGL